MNIYRIRDLKADAYMGLATSKTDGTMIRQLQDEMAREDSPLAKWPDDYELWVVGSFEDDRPDVHTHTPKLVGTIRSLSIVDDMAEAAPRIPIQGGE